MQDYNVVFSVLTKIDALTGGLFILTAFGIIAMR
jgi:hypothetical protein